MGCEPEAFVLTWKNKEIRRLKNLNRRVLLPKKLYSLLDSKLASKLLDSRTFRPVANKN